MRYSLKRLFLLCALLAAGCLYSLANTGAPRILILNSYNQGLSWTDSLVCGFRSSLLKHYPSAEFFIENIDSKRKPLTAARERMYTDYFMDEYARYNFDLVFLTDDDAVSFWVRNGEAISPGAKVVFAGVNRYTDLPDNFCGLIEAVDFATSFKLVQQLCPTAERIFVINDTTTTGKVLTQQLMEEVTDPNIVNKIEFLTGLSYSELAKRVSAIKPPDVIFLVLYNIDSHGEFRGLEAVMDSVSRVAKVPVFVPWEFYLGHGAVGGNLISPGLHGREAGFMACSLLRGENSYDLGITPGPTRDFFDYKVLKNTEIKLSQLPEDAIVLNSPYAFIRQNFSMFVAIASLLMLLLITMFSLVVINRLRTAKLKREEVLIRELSLSHQGLMDAKRKAEEASQLKSLFLANMSHEIRSPMNGIVGFANLLKDVEKISSEKRKAYIDVINANSRVLLALISDILDISKIEANQLVIHQGPCAVNHMMAELFVFFSNEKERLGVEHLTLSYSQGNPDDDFTIQTDKDRLKQILVNLIGNALKFTSKGGVEWGYIIDHSQLQFYVKDTGMGIDPSLHQQIFDRFLQNGRTLTAKSSGVGLGLAICKALVALLGGKIWVTSQLKCGATFYFTIPLVSCEANDSDEKNADLPDWSKKQILLVEKNPVVATSLLKVIKPTLASITVAETVGEAVDLCLPLNRYSVVLLNVDEVDLESPRFNSFRMHCSGKMPMIACGEKLCEATFDQYKKRGFAFWLSYPPEGDQLVAAIRSFIN